MALDFKAEQHTENVAMLKDLATIYKDKLRFLLVNSILEDELSEFGLSTLYIPGASMMTFVNFFVICRLECCEDVADGF